MQHFLALLSSIERDARNISDLVFVILKVFDNIALAFGVDAHLFLAKVQPANKFANDNHINAVVADDFRLERREMGKALGQVNGAKICERVEAATQRQQGASLWLHVDRNFFRVFVIESYRAL